MCLFLLQTEAILNRAAFEREHWENLFQYLDEGDYEDEILSRQVKFLKVLGNAALDDEQLSEVCFQCFSFFRNFYHKYLQLNGAISTMTDIYSKAEICPYNDKECDTPSLKLDPGKWLILLNIGLPKYR